ncbi:FAD/FMN-containing dehydrogenase [Salinihabitans flavidus]|uniref:FAD/FMN-containing dehydrogenase n=1 Tax=Salinihabitans flavidus TaxID=569882 RepID=A0A1H8W2Q8_9RHOB|nr:FAD-binding oxidoreductase [Salinihabitans flavidus]SEP21932.1 FAD/FMN-containing dehydrogenase [Salinihabitans flavidus]
MSAFRTVELAGWGRYPRRPGPVAHPRSVDEIATLLQGGGIIARGNGRAYGDSAMGAAATLDLRRLDRMLAFDAQSGQLVAEAGVLLGDVIAAFLPQGWFPQVTPGTKFVTLGGAIAADVHGKNHHRDGSFGAFVDWIDVMNADGKVVRASREEQADLFAWTVGGMGLTGVILRAAIRLRPVESAWIAQQTIPAPSLRHAMDAFEAADDALYSVAWVDCLAKGPALGRSLVITGDHARAADLPTQYQSKPFETPRKRRLSLPFDAPAAALNGLSVRAFNALYWKRGQRAPRHRLIDWDSYFYPLDAILGWNRIYGRRGFLQFQCALPLETSETGLAALLSETAKAGQGSFLAVLKRFGAQESRFSFPMAGYTLALDFPANARTFALLDRLDAITLDHGGRFYLAKDARLAASSLHRADPRAETFRNMRREAGLDRAFASAQSERLIL